MDDMAWCETLFMALCHFTPGCFCWNGPLETILFFASMDRIRKNRVLVVTDLVTWLGRWFYSNVAEKVGLLDARTS
jgi:hypothetical protein